MAFSDILNPVLGPLLKLDPLLAILLISLLLSVLITLIYKWMTDQELMKTLKGDIKAIQKDMKQLRNDPKKMMEANKRAMEKNMKYMTHSLKPTLITFIPLIIIFGWLSSHMAYDPLVAGEQFTVDAFFDDNSFGVITIDAMPNGLEFINGKNQSVVEDKARFLLKGEPGTYTLTLSYTNRQFDQDIILVEDPNNKEYIVPEQKIKDSNLEKIVVGNSKVTVINLFGWKLGWLGAYIIFSIIFSMGLRKILKIH